MLDGEIELLYVARPEARENTQHGACRIPGCRKVDCRLGRKAVAGPLAHVDVPRADGINGAEGDAAGQAEGSVQSAGRIIEDAVTTANDRLGQSLVSEAKTGSDVAVVGLDSGVAVHSVASGERHRGRIGIEIGPTIGHLLVGAVIFPAQAEVQSELAGETVVIGKIKACFQAARADPNQVPILLDKRRIAQQKACHGVAGSSLTGQVGKCRAEIEAAAAAIHSVFGELAATDIPAEFPGILAGSEGNVIRVLECIGAAENGHGAAGANAGEVSGRDHRQGGLERTGVGVGYSQRVSQVETGLGAFGEIGHHVAAEAGAKLIDEARRKNVYVAGHRMLHR